MKRDQILDLHWLAGLLEGEGSFFYKRGAQRCYVVVSVVGTDRDVMRRVSRLWGVPLYGPYKYGTNKKVHWQVHARGSRGAGWMRVLRPLMGQRRKQQISAALKAWREAA